MPVLNLYRSFIDNVCRPMVTPVPGSIVHCELMLGSAEHSGVYIGGNRIVQLGGHGGIVVVSPVEFLERLNGFNTAISIYVSCCDDDPVGGRRIAERAKRMIGRRRDYHVIFDNCHQFVSGCITGNFDNADNFFWMLKDTVRDNLGADTWRVWNWKD